MNAISPYATYVGFLSQGKLAYQYSRAAQRAVFYPRVVSPYDVEETLEWRMSKGFGVVYSTTVVAGRTGEYNVSLVDCDEGFRMMSRVEGCDPQAVSIGMRVAFKVLQPEADGDDPLPTFVPSGDLT